jgi:glycosyl transferase family 25
MNSIVITLELQGERIKRFQHNNPHLDKNPPDVFPGIHGNDIPDDELISSQLLTEEVLHSGLCTKGTIGVAASMRWIWQQVATFASGALVMEDDAHTHPGILNYIEDNLDQLESRDITFFGFNTDAPLSIKTTQGMILDLLAKPPYPDDEWIVNAFDKTDINSISLLKYNQGFGMMCYWISPQGAAKIERLCFPLTLEGTKIPFLREPMPGFSIDRRLCAFYPSLNAAITWPPLAYSENRDSSTRP